MQSIIVDTSVVAKWFSEEGEEDYQKARRIVTLIQQEEIHLVCPRIIFIELANGLKLGKHHDRESLFKSIQSLQSLTSEIVDLIEYERVLDLMYTYDLTSYDAIFVALAEVRKVPLITADYRHHKKSISPHIIWLSAWRGKF